MIYRKHSLKATRNNRYSYLIIISLFIFTSGFSDLKAQETPNQEIDIPNLGVSLAYFGTIPFGFAVDYKISNKTYIDFSFGIGMSAGFKYIITDPSIHRFNIFTGIYYTTMEWDYDSTSYTPTGISLGGNSAYIPLGISYLGKKNWQYSLEASAFINSKGYVAPGVGLKIGHRFFGEKKEKVELAKTSKKNILSGSLLGMTPILGIVYERLITPFLGVDIGIGLPSLGAGVKLYFPQLRDNKLSFHVGASHHFFVMPWAGGWKTYFPVGINYLSDTGFRISFDLGPKIDWYENIGSQYNVFATTNLRIGKAF